MKYVKLHCDWTSEMSLRRCELSLVSRSTIMSSLRSSWEKSIWLRLDRKRSWRGEDRSECQFTSDISSVMLKRREIRRTSGLRVWGRRHWVGRQQLWICCHFWGSRQSTSHRPRWTARWCRSAQSASLEWQWRSARRSGSSHNWHRRLGLWCSWWHPLKLGWSGQTDMTSPYC